MEHKLIHTENYLLVVSDEMIKEGDWFYNPHLNEVYKATHVPYTKDMLRVIAHLSLNNSPILQGVDLLPDLKQEDDVVKMAEYHYEMMYIMEKNDNIKPYVIRDYLIGYNKAKEKFVYTQEDMRNAISLAWYKGAKHSFNGKTFITDEDQNSIISEVTKPKLPVAFLEKGGYNGTWIGEYIY